MRDTTNNVVLVGEVMFCKGGRLSVHFCDGEIDVIGNRKQLKIYKTGVYQKIQADEVMRI